MYDFQPQVSIVIPLYNEEEVFNNLIHRLDELLIASDLSLEVVLVDDGSMDETAKLIANKANENDKYQGVFLSRNYGHQAAVSAGLESARASVAIMVMDGDLQDPPELLFDFYNKISEGYDVVYAVRTNRKESRLKKLSYWLYYRILKILSNYHIPLDSGDFSMMSRRVVDLINDMPEKSRFVRGLRSWVGFKQVALIYERDSRSKGNTKYSLKGLLALAYDGIFNFSSVPLKLISKLGMYTIIISLIYIAVIVVKKFLYSDIPEGFPTTIIALAMFSGVQLLSLGVIGEYVARIYDQTKGRPLFIIDKKIVNKEERIG